MSLIHLNHAACDSAAHRAAVTWGESDACQRREGDTQACSRRDKCSSLEAPEGAMQRAMCTMVQADPRAVCVARSLPGHSCPFTAALAARSTRARQLAERTLVQGAIRAPRLIRCLPQPLSSRGPLIAASCHRPIRRPTKAPKRPRLAPSRCSYAVPCLVLLSLLCKACPGLRRLEKPRAHGRRSIVFDSSLAPRPMTNAARPNDDLATLRHCSASLTVMPPVDLSSRLPEPGAVSRGRHSACQQPAVTFRVSCWWTCFSFPALLIIVLCPSI